MNLENDYKLILTNPYRIVYERNDDGSYNVTYDMYVCNESSGCDRVSVCIPRASIKFCDEKFDIEVLASRDSNVRVGGCVCLDHLRPVVHFADNDNDGNSYMITAFVDKRGE